MEFVAPINPHMRLFELRVQAHVLDCRMNLEYSDSVMYPTVSLQRSFTKQLLQRCLV